MQIGLALVGDGHPLCLITLRVQCRPKILKMVETQLDAITQLLEVDGLLGVRIIMECQETPD